MAAADSERRVCPAILAGHVIVFASTMMWRSVAQGLGSFNLALLISIDAELWQRLGRAGEAAFATDLLVSDCVHAGQGTTLVIARGRQMLAGE